MILYLKEDNFKVAEIPTQQNVQLNLTSGHEVAQAQETILSNSIEIYERENPKEEFAKPKHSCYDVVEQTEITISEMEAPLPSDVKPDSKQVDISFTEGEGVQITAIQPEDNEGVYIKEMKTKSNEATVKLEVQGVASKFEIESELGISNLIPDVPQNIIPKSDIIPYQAALAEEVQTRETEAPFVSVRSVVRTANIDFEIGEGVLVSDVITQDKEDVLLETEKPTVKSATFDIPTHIVAQATETTVESSIGQFTPEKRQSAIASADHVTFHSLITSETAAGDLEQSSQDFVRPDEKMVDITFEEDKSLTVTETIPFDKEKEYTGQVVMIEEQAAPFFDAHKIAEQTVFNPEVFPGDLLGDTPKSFTAKEERLPFESIMQTEAVISEKEEEFSEKALISGNIAIVGIEENIGVPTIVEVVTQDKEIILDTPEKSNEQSATVDFTEYNIAEKMEVAIDSSTGKLVDSKPITATAMMSRIPLETVVRSEIDVSESEGIYIGDKKVLEAFADAFIIENKALEISTVTLDDKEGEYKPKELPVLKSAGKNLVEGYVVAEVTDNIVDISISDFIERQKVAQKQEAISSLVTEHSSIETTLVESMVNIYKNDRDIPFNPQTAIAEQDTFESITVMENQIKESEEPFEDNFKPSTQTVDFNIQDVKSLEIYEILVQDKEDTFIPKLFEEQVGKLEFNSMSSIIVSQAMYIETETDLSSPKVPSEKTAQPSLFGREVAETIQVLPVSNTEDFIKLMIPNEEKGKTQVSELSSLVVSEIVSNDSEKVLPGMEVPSLQTAATQLLGRDVAETSEVLTVANVEKDSKLKLPEEQRGNQRLEEHSSITVTQVISNDTEDLLLSPEISTEKTAKPNLLGREIAETIQVLALSNAEELSKEKTPKQQKGKPSIEELVSLNVSQIVSNETENVLLSPKAPSQMTAQSNLFGQEIAETSEIQTLSNVSELIKPKSPENQVGKPQVDTLLSSIVSETVSQESEDTLPEAEIPSTKVAQPSLYGRDIAETSEVLTISSAHKLSKKVKPDEQKGILEVEEFSSLTVSQIIPNETEDFIPEEQVPSGMTAFVELLGREIAETNETITVANVQELTKPEVLEGQKGKPQLDSLTSATISQVLPNEVEGILLSSEILSEQKAKPGLLGRKIAETSEVLTVSNVEELKTKPSEERQGKPHVDTLSSLSVSQVFYNEMEEFLPSSKVPNTYNAQPNLFGREAAEVTEIFIVTNASELQKSSLTELEQAQPQLEELSSVIIAQVISNEMEKKLPETSKPSSKLAESCFLKREIAETSEVLTVTETEELKMSKKPELQIGSPKLDVLSSLIISQAISAESGEQLPIAEFPSKKKAEPSLSGHEVAEITEISTLASAEEFLKTEAPHEKTGAPQIEALSSIIVSQTLTNEAGDKLRYHETPTGNTAITSLFGRNIAETFEVQTAATAQEFIEPLGSNEQKGKTELEELSSLLVSQVISHESENVLSSPASLSTKEAQPNLLGRKLAQTSEVVIALNVEELSKSESPEKQVGKTTLGILSSLIVSETVSTETEEILSSSGKRSEKIAQSTLFCQEIAETNEIITVSNVEDFIKQKMPNQETGKEEWNLLPSITVSETISQDTEEKFLNSDVPNSVTAFPSMTNRKVPETSEQVTINTVNKLSVTILPEEQISNITLDALSSLTVSEITLNEQEDVLTQDKQPSEVRAQSKLDSIEAAEILEVLTTTHADEFSNSFASKKQKATREIEEMSSLTVSQVMTNELEGNLHSSEVPNKNTAIPNIVGREVSDTSEILTAVGAEELVHQKAPGEHKGVPKLNELASLIISQTLSVEAENRLPSPTIPGEKTAQPNLSCIDVVETTQILTLASTAYLPKPQISQEQQSKPQVEELASVTVSQVMPSENEEIIPLLYKFDEKTANINISAHEVISQLEMKTMTTTKEIPKLEKSVKQLGKTEFEKMNFITVSETISNELETALITSETPKEQTAISNIPKIETAQTTEVLTLTSYKKLPPSKLPEEQRGEVNLDEMSSLTISEVTYNENGNELWKNETPTQTVKITYLTRPEAEITQIITSTSTKDLSDSAQPEFRKVVPEQITFESLVQSQNIVQENVTTFGTERKSSVDHADISFRIPQGIEVTQVNATEKEGEKVIRGVAKEGNAQPDVVDRKVAVKTEILPANLISEFQPGKPISETASAKTVTKHSLIVTQLGTDDEIELDLSPSMESSSKIANVLIEDDHMERIEGKSLILEIDDHRASFVPTCSDCFGTMHNAAQLI